MREHDYNKSNVLGVDVCDMRTDRAVALSLDILRNHELGTVFFHNAVSSLFCQETDWAMELMNSFQLVLPGDQHMESAVAGRELSENAGRSRYADEYMKKFLMRMNWEYREIFVTTDSSDRLQMFKDYLNRFYPNISFQGMVCESGTEGAADRVVNEINACIPDAVLLLLPAQEQLEFLRDYETMLNAGLCIGIESLKTLLSDEADLVPAWIRLLHLDSLYHRFRNKEKLQSRIAGTIFQKRVNEDISADTEHDEQNMS